MQPVLTPTVSAPRTRPAWPARLARPARTRSPTAVVAVSALLLAGCSNTGSAGTSSTGAATSLSARDSAQPNAAPGAKPAAGAPAASPGLARSGASAVGLGPKITRSAAIDLRVTDIGAAAAQVRETASRLQAQVLDEQIGRAVPGDPTPLPGKGGPPSDVNGYGTLTLSVPSDRLDTALDQLANGRIGTVLQRSVSSRDVTSQYVDTQSRLRTMTASLTRVRALMVRAKDLGQVVTLEGELSRREADLESLQSQLDELRTSVERSTLSVSLSTPGNEPPATGGFSHGLRSGWDAFTASAGALLAALGAVLPFAVFLALVGLPIWWSWRRRRPNGTSVTPAPAGPVPSA
jgi:hypothetical protein